MSEATAAANVRRVIWMSFLGAVVVYTTLGLSGIFKTAEAPIGATLLPILAGASVVMAIAAVILRGRLFDRVANMPENDPGRPAAMTLASVIPWSFDESIAVFGYVLMMLGRPPIQWLPFCAVSFAMLLLHAPRKES